MADPQEILDLWNAALNPPYAPSRVGDLTFSSQTLKSRNDAIEAYNIETNPDEKDRLKRRIDYLNEFNNPNLNHDSFSALELDPYRVYSMEEIFDIQTEKANRTFIKYEEKKIGDVETLISEIATDISSDWEANGIAGTFEDAESFVSENLFYNWEFDFRERATLTDRLDRGETVADTYAFERLNAYSGELASSPETLLNNDKFWSAIDAAVDIV